jgi:hypothetical protein
MKVLLAVALAGAAQPQSAVDAVSLAVARGIEAEQAGDGRAMLAAARRLEALGARPAPDGENLAQHWRRLARARGVKDPTPPVRGRALGPAYARGVLAPGRSFATEQLFLAGQKAEVALVPQRGRSLAFRLEAGEKRICERTAQAPRASCAWLPVFTSRVAIRVLNPSRDSVAYVLVSN